VHRVEEVLAVELGYAHPARISLRQQGAEVQQTKAQSDKNEFVHVGGAAKRQIVVQMYDFLSLKSPEVQAKALFLSQLKPIKTRIHYD
jgi:hypothetical protein